MSYTMKCGCEFDAYVTISWDCDCCGREYDIEEAEIVHACSDHGGY